MTLLVSCGRERYAVCLERLVALLIGVTILASPAILHAGTTTVTQTVFAGPEDSNGDGVFDTFFNISISSEVSVETRTGFERRAILEFDLNAIPAGSTITAANLQWFTGVVNAGLTVPLYGYAGDGVAQLTDATAGSIVIASLTPVSGSDQSYNVTAFVQSLFGSARWAGFNVRSTTSGAGRYAIEKAPVTTTYDPRLVITFTPPPPVITAINPSTGPTTGGTLVSITGSNFVVGATTVMFGATPGTSVSCSSTTQCTATSPSGSGTVSVRATTSSGTSADTAADDFTYTIGPTTCANFSAATNYAVGTAPRSEAVGDFDGNGIPDLATANNLSNDFSILLGTGTGTFGAATNFAAGTNPHDVAIGDFNDDGISDLAVVNHSSNNVSIALGTGTGTFGAAANFAVGFNPTSVAIGDFNADGRSDLAVANQGSDNVSILLGTGTGTFGAATNFTAGTQSYWVATGDFNGDGRSDLAVTNFTANNVSILLGTGTGTFGAATNYAVGANPIFVAIADLNGDGILDLAVANRSSNTVSILLGTGSGTFGTATNFAVGSLPNSVAIGDFNGDGILDLAVPIFGDNNVSILLGTGTGTFGAATTFAVGTSPLSVVISDFNADGRNDLAVLNRDSNDVSVLLNTGCPPVVTAINPSTGPTGGGTVVNITGSNFVVGGTSVNFGPNPAASVSCSSATMCAATSPAGIGTVSVRVMTSSGMSVDTAADDFTYVAGPATSCTNFSGPTNFATSPGPFSVAASDYNGDGIRDLAVANFNSNTVSILLGTGTGMFGAATNFVVGTAPVSVVAGEFNGDGIRDLAVANNGTNDVSILLGTGTGTFGSATNFAVGSSPQSVAIGDFNSDGRSDLAVANFTSNNVSILLGTGTGTFGPATNFAAGSAPRSVAIGDFNSDGRSDLAVANLSSNNVSILLGTGTGAFGPATNFAVGATPTSVAIGDFNGDGIRDLAVANNATNDVSSLLGTGSGTFGTATNFAVGSAPQSVAIGDFNADGKSDLAVANNNTNDVSVLPGTGTGAFGPATNFAAGTTSQFVAISDFNGDGRSDLAVANTNSNNVSILLNAGCPPVVTSINPSTGPAGGGTVVTITGSNFIVAATSVSFGANPATGVSCSSATMCTATSPAGSGTVSVRVTTSSGTSADTAADDFTYTAAPTACTNFGAPSTLTVGTDPLSVAIADFNGDGQSDLAVANIGSNTVSILLGTGSGTFGAPTNFSAGAGPRSIAIGDFNGDGSSDLAVVNQNSNDVSILLGNGNGTFGTATSFGVGTSPQHVAVGDFNGDGRTDLAAANFNSNNVSILLGTGGGSFSAATNFSVGTNPNLTGVGDFNADGKSDLAVANINSNDVSILLGSGTGSFGTATNFSVGASPYSLAIRDFNGDGFSDLAVANFNSNNVSILLGAGTGSFGTATNFIVGTNPVSVAAGDFNGDGQSDLVVANNGAGSVSLLQGTGTGSFGAASNFSVGTNPYSVAIADFNSDGRSDLAVANQVSSDVSILLNTTAPGTLALSSTSYSAGEAAGSVTITVSRTSGTDCTVTLDYATSNGTATAGSDYTATSGTLTFGPGVTSQSFMIPITNDVVFEGNENFTVTISNAGGGAMLGATAMATVTIVEDDPMPALAIDNVTQAEGNTGTTNFTFTVTLTPASAQTATVNFATVDGSATAPGDYTAGSGKLTFLPGVTMQTITVPVIGDMTNEADETFTVTLSGPVGATIATGTGTGTIQNDDAQPALTINNVMQVEANTGTTNFTFTVTLSPASGQTVTVNYATADSTATAPSDYASTSGTLTFLPGVTMQTITVPVIGDTTSEADETFTVTLSGPVGATIATSTGTGTIQNDDAQPALTINNVTQVEANTGTTNFTFTVTLSPASGQTVTVNYATADSTATAPSDYASASGTLTFAPGVTSQSISVPVVGDTINEPDESFLVVLSSPVNATVPAGVGAGTIQNDDGAPTLSINNISQSEGNAGTTNFDFNVTLSPASGQTVTVDFATSDGSATAPSDFAATSGTLTFAPGVTTQVVSVPVNGDATFETDETFTVNLSAPTNATITTATGTATIVNDDAATADLAISKTASGPFVTGQNATFNIAVNNTGPTTATSVVVTDVLPAGVTFVSAISSQGSCSGTSTVTCNLGTIANGGSASVAVTVTLNSTGNLSNTATVTSPQPDPNATNNSSTATINVQPAAPPPVNADLSVTMTATPPSVRAGENVTYTIVGRNNGPDFASNITIAAMLSSGSTLVSASGSGWICSGSTIVTCTTGGAAIGDMNPITLVVMAPATAGSMSATATISSSANDPNGGNSASTVQTSVEPQAASCTDVPPALIAPAANAADLESPVSFSWGMVPGAAQYDLFITSSDGATFDQGPLAALSATVPLPSGNFTWYVTASFPGDCPTLVSERRTFSVKANVNCTNNGRTSLISPAANTTVESPVTFNWTAVPNAIGYQLVTMVNNGALESTPAQGTTITLSVLPGKVTWFVEAIFPGCPATQSDGQTFNVPRDCTKAGPTTLVAPIGRVTLASSNVHFQWIKIDGADGYRVWTKVAEATTFSAVGETGANETTLDSYISLGLVEWFVETLYDGCASQESQHDFFIVPQAQNCTSDRPVTISPANGSITTSGTVTFTWTGVANALSYQVWLSVGNGTDSLLADAVVGTSVTAEVSRGELEWFVRASVNGCPSRDSDRTRFTYRPPANCPEGRPILISPPDAALTVTSPVTFDWSKVPNATGYNVYTMDGNGNPQKLNAAPVTDSQLRADLAAANVTWFVEALFGGGCSALQSTMNTFTVIAKPTICLTPSTPVILAPSQVSSSVQYTVRWEQALGADGYQLQEATNPIFSDPVTIPLTGQSVTFQHANTTSDAQPYFYRVRATAKCTEQTSPFSDQVIVVVLPTVTNEGALPAETTQPITYAITIDRSFAGQTFTATPNQPFLTVTPSSGIVGANGTIITVLADTSRLPVGTSIGGVVITTSGNVAPASAGGSLKPAPNADGSTKTTTLTVSLVNPVSPTPKNTPPPDALIIPAVAHADGINSRFQSDVRVTNTSPELLKYQLTFTPTGEDGIASGKQTTISVEPGQTVALDDVLRTFFSTSGNMGMLEIRPQTQTSSATSSAATTGLSNRVTFASSRTYNVTGSGTFGQAIAAVPFANFIGQKSGALSLQQIAQSAAYRTNLGLVEGSGQAASLLVSIFGDSGQKMRDVTVNMNGGQQLQLNSFLASQGLSVNDGRVEVRVTSPGGRVTAYASVLDNRTNDPLLVTPVNLSQTGGSKYIVPGVADLTTGLAAWRTDLRVLNASSSSVDATLNYYSQSGGAPKTTTLTIGANQVAQLDQLLESTFGLKNDGGALQITTAQPSNLVATARTYNQTGNGTFGQFIQAVTPNDAIGQGARPLQLLQVEDSDRYRSNIGIVEVTGQPAVVEVTVYPPDSKAFVRTQIPMKANEFRQIRLLRSLGLGDTYNARVTIKVVGGQGKVTAYSSVIDMQTQDPTYNQAQ